MSGMRWVRLFVPSGRMECEMFGDRPVVIGEAAKGVGREVRLATDQEAGMFGRLALPPVGLQGEGEGRG